MPMMQIERTTTKTNKTLNETSSAEIANAAQAKQAHANACAAGFECAICFMPLLSFAVMEKRLPRSPVFVKADIIYKVKI